MEDDLNFFCNWKTISISSPSFSWAWHSSAPACCFVLLFLAHPLLANLPVKPAKLPPPSGEAGIPTDILSAHTHYHHTVMRSQTHYHHTVMRSHTHYPHTVMISHAHYHHKVIRSHTYYHHTGMRSYTHYHHTVMRSHTHYMVIQ